jgi:two-component system, NarL family, nitrate/nitrite response regulator NarL
MAIAGARSMIRIFILTRTRLLHQGLALALGNHSDFEVTGAARGLQQAVERLREQRPDIALVDVAGAADIDSVRLIRKEVPAVQVVALAVPEVEDLIIGCAEAGIAGYVTRDGSLTDLRAAIRSVSRGETLCSPRIAASLLRRLSDLAAQREPLARPPRLTARELEIVELIDEGLSNKEIATRLCIGLATVKNHVHNILEKLQVSRRGEAAARVRGGLPDGSPSLTTTGSSSPPRSGVGI